MQNTKTIQIPQELYSYLWSRYLPETTFKTYAMIGYLQAQNLKGEEATNRLLGARLDIETEIGILRDEKERVINKLGYNYPQNRKDDIEILLNFKLVKIAVDELKNLIYIYNLPVPKPEEVLNLDEQEKQTLENIRFELTHQDSFNNILTLLLNSNGNMLTTVEHIHRTTKVKYSDIKEVLKYLVEEGSIKVKCDKPIEDIRKEDKVYINIIKEVFEEKRFVID